MTVAFTGHRPDKLGGYNKANPMNRDIINALKQGIDKYCSEADTFISGMALGIDQWAADIVLSSRPEAKLIAAIPFTGQESRWPLESKREYHRILKLPNVSQITISSGFSNAAYQERNRYMVDASSLLIAVWDGSDGGTGNCVNYALAVKKPIWILSPRTLEWTKA